MEGTREPFTGKGVLFKNAAGIKRGFPDLLRELLGFLTGGWGDVDLISLLHQRMVAMGSIVLLPVSCKLLAMIAVACLSNKSSSVSSSARVKTRLRVSSFMIASRASSKRRGLFNFVVV